MNVERLLQTLEDRGVALFVQGASLHFRAPAGALDAELKRQITTHRSEIIRRIDRQPGPQAPPGLKRCSLYDTQYWIDEPPRDGRIRTRCGRCGRFIGYRPDNLV